MIEKFPLHGGYCIYVKFPNYLSLGSREVCINKINCLLYYANPLSLLDVSHSKRLESLLEEGNVLYYHLADIRRWVRDIVGCVWTPPWYDAYKIYDRSADLM